MTQGVIRPSPLRTKYSSKLPGALPEGGAQGEIYRECGRMTIKRGDIYYADLSPVVGSEQGGVRPVLIVQNDVGNKFSPTVIAAAITSQKDKTRLPTHIQLHSQDCGLAKDSVVLLEQVRTIDKKRLKERMGRVDEPYMDQIDRALSISFGLGGNKNNGAT